MTTISILGIDIAKNTFQLHGADNSGKAVHRKRLARRELAAHVANLPACTIVMEACGGANYWARVFQRSSHLVKLISPQFVKPFVKTNKNDANDAQAIVEAASRPSMHFVPIKQVEQQDVQSIHRIRTRIVKNRTALINEIRSLCQEYGVVLTPGAARVKYSLCVAIADSDNELTPSSRESMQDLYEELVGVVRGRNSKSERKQPLPDAQYRSASFNGLETITSLLRLIGMMVNGLYRLF